MLWKIGSGLSRLKALIVGLQPHRRWRDDVGANIRRQSLEARIEKIKEEIARLGDLRPGASSQQYVLLWALGNVSQRVDDDRPVLQRVFAAVDSLP